MKALRRALFAASSFIVAAAGAVAQTTHFLVTQAGGDTALASGAYVSGTPMSVRVQALNVDGTVDTTNNRTVTLSIIGLPSEDVVTATATLVGGEADAVSVTPNLAGTENLRFSATDGNVVDDDASGNFSVNPYTYTVTIAGSAQSVSRNPIIEGDSLRVRVTARNFDGSVSQSYSGLVQVASSAFASSPDFAFISYGGVSDDVNLSGAIVGTGYTIEVTDGVVTTGLGGTTADVSASDSFDVIADPASGAALTATNGALTASNPGFYPGLSVRLRYKLNNATADPIAAPYVVFRLVDTDNAVVLTWNQVHSFTINNSAETGFIDTFFVIPLWAAPGSWRVEVLPGGSIANQINLPFTVAGLPNLRITNFQFSPGTYRAGDAMRFRLGWGNTNFSPVSPFPPSTRVPNNVAYRVELHLSRDSEFGGTDDFLLWQGAYVGNSVGGIMLAGQEAQVADSFLLPTNFTGTYYLLAKINSAGGSPDFASGISESFGPEDEALLINGDNETIGIESAKITILAEDAPTTQRISLTTAGLQSSLESANPVISQDGRVVAFESYSALAAPSSSGVNNIFVRDQVSGTLSVLSVSTAGTVANGHSRNPSISSDGRYIVFESDASNLVPLDTNGATDIFLADTLTGTLRRVSVTSSGTQANRGSFLPTISGNGRWIAFETTSSNLVSGISTAGTRQIVLLDRDVAGTGDYDTGGNISLTLVSQVSGAPGLTASSYPRISRDGSYIVFQTQATNLLGVTNSPFTQLIRWQRSTGTLLTVTASGSTLGDNDSGFAAINADGSVIAFPSRAQNLDATLTSADYTSAIPHMFRAVITGGAVTEIRRLNAEDGSEMDNPDSTLLPLPDLGSFDPSISDDGSLITFTSESSNLLGPVVVRDVDGSYTTSTEVQNYFDDNISADVYVYDVSSGSIERVSKSSFGFEASIYTTSAGVASVTPASSRAGVISGDGRYVAFASVAKGHHALVFGATNFDYVATNSQYPDIYVHDRKTTSGYAEADPSVTLTMPAAQTVASGTPVPLVATANSIAGTIASVTFYVDGALVGTVTAPSLANTYRYTFTWTPSVMARRVFQVQAIATDSRGIQSAVSSSVTVTVTPLAGTLAPSVSMLNPSAAERVTAVSSLYLIAEASDADGDLEAVEFYVNGTLHETLLRSGANPGGLYVFSSAWTPATAGVYTILAVARDTAGNRTVSTSVTIAATAGSQPPTISLSPSGSLTANLNSTINFTATASDTGTVQSVSFYVDGVLAAVDTVAPYTAGLTILSTGIYQVVAVALDDSNNRTSSNVVTVTGVRATGAVPAVTITQPTLPVNDDGTIDDDAVVLVTTSSDLRFTARALDSDGTIVSVTFYLNGESVGTGTRVLGTNLWSYDFGTFANRGAGTYLLTATAVDDSGYIANSGSIPIFVVQATSLAPTVTLSSVPSLVSSSSTALLAALAIDPDGAITSVEFFASGTSLGLGTADNVGTTFSLSVTNDVIRRLGIGTFSITAVATDSTGNISISDARDMTISDGTGAVLPLIEFSYAPTLATSKSDILIYLYSVDPDGAVRNVDLYAGGVHLGEMTKIPTLPIYRKIVPASTVATLGVGILTFSAVATDNDGNTATQTVQVAVGPAVIEPPSSIEVVTVSNELYYGDHITLTSLIAQSYARVESVKYLYGGNPLNSFDDSPNPVLIGPTFRYQANSYNGGIWEVVAEATDAGGNLRVSDPIQIKSASRNSVLPGLNPFGTPEDFVKQVFADFLQRGPGVAEVTQYAAIARTSGYGAALDAILSLSEFADVRETAAVTKFIIGRWPNYDELVEFTNRLRGELDKVFDEDGVEVDIISYIGGLPPLETETRAERTALLMQFLFDAGYYQSTYGSIPDMTVNSGDKLLDNVRIFVDRLYQNLLGRNATGDDVFNSVNLLSETPGIQEQNPLAITVLRETGEYAYGLYAARGSALKDASIGYVLLLGATRKAPTTAQIGDIDGLSGAARYNYLKVLPDYIRRFTFAGSATSLGNDWYYLDWFGNFNTTYGRWFYHETLGWQYVPAASATSESVFLWDATMGSWLWTKDTYFPWIYRYSDRTWLYYKEGTKAPRYFYNATTDAWETR